MDRPWQRRARSRDVIGAEMGRDDVAGGGRCFVVKAPYRDGSSLEDAPIEWLGFASEQRFNARSRARGSPASAAPLQ